MPLNSAGGKAAPGTSQTGPCRSTLVSSRASNSAMVNSGGASSASTASCNRSRLPKSPWHRVWVHPRSVQHAAAACASTRWCLDASSSFPSPVGGGQSDAGRAVAPRVHDVGAGPQIQPAAVGRAPQPVLEGECGGGQFPVLVPSGGLGQPDQRPFDAAAAVREATKAPRSLGVGPAGPAVLDPGGSRRWHIRCRWA